MKLQVKNIAEKLKKNKYVILMLAVGLILLLWPGGEKKQAEDVAAESGISNTQFSLAETESRLEKILSKIDGAGKVSVMLSVSGSTERIVAENVKSSDKRSDGSIERTEETNIVITGSGSSEGVVELSYIFPEYTGAVIIAEGAASTAVQLNIIKAVRSVTGLSSDRISVIKMEKP